MSEVPPAAEPVATPDPVAAPATTSSTGLQPNVAAAVSYVLGWITGLIFFLIEKDDRFVRFHAMQSILLSVAIMALYFVVGILIVPMAFASLGFVFLLLNVLWIAILVLWIYMIVQAAQNKVFKLPLIGDMAAKQAGL